MDTGTELNNQGVVRIAPALVEAVDELIDKTRDPYGVKIWRSRKHVVEEAVRRLLQQELPKEKVKAAK